MEHFSRKQIFLPYVPMHCRETRPKFSQVLSTSTACKSIYFTVGLNFLISHIITLEIYTCKGKADYIIYKVYIQFIHYNN